MGESSDMEDELRNKIYDMHGTVKQLDAKLDAVGKKLERIDNDVEEIEEEIEAVEEKAANNRKKIFAITAIGGFASTLLIIASQVAGGLVS